MSDIDAPPPLVDAEVDLTDFPFMPIMIAQLLRSRAWLICKKKPHLAYYMLNLWMAAWHGRPAASIENDDMVLADVAGCDEKTWIKVKSEVLRGWVQCSDGRLYHPTVADRVKEAWDRKLARRLQTEGARLAREAKRLREHATIKAEVDRLSGMTSSDATSSVTETVTGNVTIDATSSKGQGQGQGQGQGDNTSLRSEAGEGRSIGDRFMDAYPLDVAPDGVERELRRRIGEGVDPEDIIAGAARYAKTVAGKPPDKIANPVTWLRDGRWKDGKRKVAFVVTTPVDKTRIDQNDPRWGDLKDRWRRERGRPLNNSCWWFPNDWLVDLHAGAA